MFFPSFYDSIVQTQVDPHVLTGLWPHLGGREATGTQAKREIERVRERTRVDAQNSCGARAGFSRHGQQRQKSGKGRGVACPVPQQVTTQTHAESNHGVFLFTVFRRVAFLHGFDTPLVLLLQRPSPEPARRLCVSLRVSDRFLALKSRPACYEAAMPSAAMLFSGSWRPPVRLRIGTAGSACQLVAPA